MADINKMSKEELAQELTKQKANLEREENAAKKLTIVAEIGNIEGQLRAVNNGFEDEESRKLFGTVGAMYERSKLAAETKTDFNHDYSYILGDLSDIKEKMWNTFNYDKNHQSTVNLESLRDRLNDKVVKKFLNDEGGFINDKLKNYFGDAELLRGVKSIKPKKGEGAGDIIMPADLHAEAGKARAAGMDSDAYRKYIYMLRDAVRLGNGISVRNHFQEMITDSQFTPEEKKANLDFIKQVAENLATEGIRSFDKDVDRRADAMKKAAEGKFGTDEYTVSVDQGNVDIDERKLDPYATSKSVSRQLALRQIHKEYLAKKNPAAYDTLRADLMILEEMNKVSSGAPKVREIMNELHTGIAPHLSRMKDRVNRVKNGYENPPENLIIDPVNDEVEYIAPEADTKKTSRFSQIKNFTDFFKVKHNMVENAKNFIKQIAATTNKPDDYSAHSEEYKKMHQSLKTVSGLQDNATPVQVYRAIETLRNNAGWYHAVMASKMHLSGGAKRVEISKNIKNICDEQLKALEETINSESSEYKAELANTEFIDFNGGKSKTAGLLDVKKGNKEEVKGQLIKISRDTIHKKMKRIRETLERVTKHADVESMQTAEFNNMYNKVLTLETRTSPDTEAEYQLSYEGLNKKLRELGKAAKDYREKNGSILNLGNEALRVQTAQDLEVFCSRRIGMLDLSKTLENAPKNNKTWDNTDVRAEAGTKNYDPKETFGMPGWVTKASTAAGKYMGALETIQTRAKTLFAELNATLGNDGLKGRTEHFKKMYSALQTVSEIDVNKKSHTEIAKNVQELEAAAKNYHDRRNSGWHRSAGAKRLAVSKEILGLNISDFLKLDKDLEVSGYAMMDDTPADIQKNVSEIDLVNRERNPEKILGELQRYLNAPVTGAKAQLLDAISKKDSNKTKEALKTCFETNNAAEVETAKLRKQHLATIRKPYPQEAMDYIIDNGMADEFLKSKTEKKVHDEYPKLRENEVKKQKLLEEKSRLEAERKKIELQYMNEIGGNSQQIKKLKTKLQAITKSYNEELQEYEEAMKEKMVDMKARDKKKTIPVETWDEEWSAFNVNHQFRCQDFKTKINIVKEELDRLENTPSKKKLDDKVKEIESKQKEIEELDGALANPELVITDEFMTAVHTKGWVYGEQSKAYKKSVEDLQNAKGDEDFRQKLSDVLEKGHKLRTAMFGDVWSVKQKKEEEKSFNAAKKNLKENWESISIAYTKDQIIDMVSRSKDAAEFNGIVARFAPERLDCRKFLNDKNFGTEPLSVDGKLNEKAVNSCREDLRAGVCNNRKKLQELKNKYEQTSQDKKKAREDIRKEIDTCVGNMLDFSAALLAVNEMERMEKRYSTITRGDDKVTIQSVISKNSKLRLSSGEKKGQEIGESYFDHIRNSETFQKIVLKCNEDAKNNADPFAAVNLLTDKILHNDPKALQKFIEEANPTANASDRFDIAPAEKMERSIGEDLRLNISLPRRQVVQEVVPISNKKEREKEIGKLVTEKDKAGQSAYITAFNAELEFGYHDSYSQIKQNGKEEEFLDKLFSILYKKGFMYDTAKKIGILKDNEKGKRSFNSAKEEMGLEYESTREAMRKICRTMSPQEAIKCCEDGSIIEQLKIMKHEMPEHLDATHSINPADKPLNEMTQEERDERVNRTKQILGARCHSIAVALNTLQTMKENKDPEYSPSRYDSLVKEAVRDLAILTSIKIREHTMKKNKGDPYAKEKGTLDRLFIGGTREVVDKSNKNAEPRLAVKCGLASECMRKNFFRHMMEGCKNVPGETNGHKYLMELLHSASLENDKIAQVHAERVKWKTAQPKSPFITYINSASGNFKTFYKDDVLNTDPNPNKTVRDANRTFEVAGVKITPLTDEDLRIFGQDMIDAKRNHMKSYEEKYQPEVYAVKKCIDPKEKDDLKDPLINNVIEALNAEKQARNLLHKEQSKESSPMIRKIQKVVSARIDNVVATCNTAIRSLAEKKSFGLFGGPKYAKEIEALKKLRDHYDKQYNKEERKKLNDTVSRKIDSLKHKTDAECPLHRVAAEMIVCGKIISDPSESNESIKDQLDPIAFKANVEEVLESKKFEEFTKKFAPVIDSKESEEFTAKAKIDDKQLRQLVADGKVLENYEPDTAPQKGPDTEALKKSALVKGSKQSEEFTAKTGNEQLRQFVANGVANGKGRENDAPDTPYQKKSVVRKI